MISVCIPTYNGARYIEACLTSVIGQTYDDFEILVVDDRSTDGTFELLSRFAARETRIRLYGNSRNLGLVANWNRCVELAGREWIKFVFQDDLLHSSCLERMATAVDDCDRFIACSRTFQFDATPAPQLRDFYLRNKQLIDNLYTGTERVTAEKFSELVVDRIGANLVGEPTVTMLHRSVFEQFGGFNESLIMSCDLEYWTRIGIHTGLRFIPEELAVFRVHNQAASATNRRDRQYRMNVLDNLAILHDIVTQPVYEPLRRAAALHAPPIPLDRMLRDGAHVARVIAEQFDSIDLPLMDEWKRFMSHYPGLKVGGLGHLYWCARNRSICKMAEKRMALP